MFTTHGPIARGVVVAALTVAAPLSGMADGLPQPTGDVVLRVTGDIAVTNTEGAAVLDTQMLADIGETTFSTTTIWTEGEQSFTGVELEDLLDALGVDEGMLEARALNDYMVEIPVSDAVEGGPIIAYLRNGEPMSVRDKGPLWIVYPYDLNTDYASELIYSRSIWQLDRIEVVR
ncbi:molybdopterin-dependent oxidoreductase [Maritimibacter sp.]|uniref:molybdopterin-dependent oxidoreductase n=1 Tax=Maritimibacter sp. TaxID=2003363 RepID=UPI00257F586F|nr:molybdopterin-dependent oxidoreductase [Maritimibacter sp.]